MKYSYFIQEIDMGSYKRMYFNLKEELEPVSVFLNMDVTGEESGNFFISSINKVINGEISINKTGGNTCSLTIRPDFTDIEEKYLKKRRVQIETSELMLLIEAFVTEKNKYEEIIN